ncbi:glycosyltransferase, group 2 family protein [Geofilum rubicundum JCM 15548]|uniref:Glycosyltransferase, group 2 family protein n=1 Tax=Geofilum rubicundum JCM 15548 TaxID=1236989 RepID=A0A0E9LVQ9_9BACT|nr:glycosyltransferase, group 2 family protein [Geofilum rubicundum JCM 15548]
MSVVIVTYNCRSFVQLCLYSLLWQTDERLEVIVVDNDSQDDTVQSIKEQFPQVILIANQSNVGFGTACNQGMQIARGRYYLMLNPDTFVPEDLSQRVVTFMDAHQTCGAMGVHMCDGTGRFLPESKRGLPTLFRSFCRFSGLSTLFPASKTWAGYYMGHLPVEETAPVEILSGAFMVLSRAAIEKVGGFDETFFMYGEDIDLSWRIHQAGFTNYYVSDIKIVHFKGESTAKDQRYVKMFYGAMELFYKKHFGARQNGVQRLLVQWMIATLGLLSSLRRLLPSPQVVAPAYPLQGDYVVLAGDQWSSSCVADTLISGKGKVLSDAALKDAVSAETCLLDVSSCRPSKILDFVRIKGFFCKRLLWLAPGRKMVFHPVSSSNRTVITKLD